MTTSPAARPATRRRVRGQAGTTLIEIVVATSIMSVVMVMFTAGILQMYRSANRHDASATAQAQVHLAFQRLDREIRYASAISTPGTVGGDAYVEYLTTSSGTRTCTELRVHVANQQLQRRTWVQGTTPLVPGPWAAQASGLSGAQPFTVVAADPTYNFQRLQLSLTASAGAGTGAITKRTDITFTALNTSLGTSSAGVCTEGRSIP